MNNRRLTAEPVSRDQSLRREWGQGKIIFSSMIGNLTPVDPYSAICDDNTHSHIHTVSLPWRVRKRRVLDKGQNGF